MAVGRITLNNKELIKTANFGALRVISMITEAQYYSVSTQS